MKRNIELDRRKVLGTVGGLALAGSGLAAFTGSAAAEVETKFKAHNTGTVTTPDGKIRKVLVDTTGSFAWKNLDSAAESATVTLSAKAKNGSSYNPIATKTYSINGLSGERSFDLDKVDLTDTDYFGDDDFESETDGEKQPTAIDLQISVTVTSTGSGDPNPTASADSRMWVGTKNAESNAEVEGDSTASASSYDQLYTFTEGGHPNLNSDGEDDDGDGSDNDVYSSVDVVGGRLHVEAYYDNDPSWVTYVFRLPAAFASGSQDNIGVVFDKGANGAPNFQGMYHSSDGIGYKTYDGSGWSGPHWGQDLPDYLEVNINDSTDAVTVSVKKSKLASNFRVGFRLAYAGQGTAKQYPASAGTDNSTTDDTAGTNFAMYTVPYHEANNYFTSSEDYLSESY
ncbi:hypothetical protein [Halorussus salinisoli]|uniref:hypothetical protein n=1 Tax=Halorussus salinisoli TaxID=2558242 RepID=UPI0010C1B4C0|nr:hypothetical protein [Halorussus salinisoli]